MLKLPSRNFQLHILVQQHSFPFTPESIRARSIQLFHLADTDRIHHPFHLHNHRFSVNAPESAATGQRTQDTGQAAQRHRHLRTLGHNIDRESRLSGATL